MPPQHLQGVGVTTSNDYLLHANSSPKMTELMVSTTTTSAIDNSFSGASLRTKDIQQLSTKDMDQLELAEESPRAIPSYDPLSPRVLSRTAKENSSTTRDNRRPLSIISSSSLNSDYSPGSDISPGLTPGSALSLTPGINHNYKPVSPGRHRRHRSMLVSGLDYRTQQYNSCNGYSPYQPFPLHQPLSLQHSYQHSYQTPGPPSNSNANHHPNHHAYQVSNSSPRRSLQTSPSAIPLVNPHTSFSHNSSFHSQESIGHSSGSYFEPENSPNSSHSNIPMSSALSQAMLKTASNEFQDIFIVLAYKERQVLEAKQAWEAAKEELSIFRQQIDDLISPESQPVLLPSRPTVISRRHQPNLGVYALQYSSSNSPIPPKYRQHIVSWKIDNEVPTPSHPNSLDEIIDVNNQLIRCPQRKCGVAFRIVDCLLGIVHCIISTFPVHQRDIQHVPQTIYWHPEYPTPMNSLFGHMCYQE